MSSFAQGIFEDLRQRRLLPAAGLLLIVLIALPTFMLKKSSPAPAVTPTASATPAAANGLPSPQQALSGDKPLVSLAVLEDPSTLDTYRQRNPFKPLQKLTADATTDSGSSLASDASNAETAAGSAGGASSGGSSGGGGSSGSTQTPSSPSTPDSTTTSPTQTTPQPTTPDTTPKKDEKLTYALDLSFRSAGSDKTYKSVAKLRMLPSQNSPLFIYLGVNAEGTKAVFLVDSTLTVTSGEGTCKPNNASCATVEIAPGEISRFRDPVGNGYELEVDQLRLISASKAAASARKAAKAAAVSTKSDPSKASVASARRFVPPVITDLFVGASR